MAGLDNHVKRCRTALHGAVSAVIVAVVAVLGLAIAPVADAAAPMATLTVELKRPGNPGGS
ncbi:hypothetical protein [Mycobacterium avium]|uniref:hypothetical protein n=1 Tax=Mycobacterium avium TaxID=1764 RepID=UPI0012DA5B44